jgi:aspartyl-tRNA(Asn)/glutamyl-tRNA(Gln) amidotransferase subunit B
MSGIPIATAALDRFEAVIGIEVHCRPRTASKMFCPCSADFDGARPNSHVCPVCFGLPGALPVINRLAVEHVIATGLAIDATIPPATRWDRKNYFYPDLPKGYQISQYDLPLASNGHLTFETSGGTFTVGIRRAHLEEDTARLQHTTTADGRRVSLVDFNRSGAPLMEIVTEPDIRTAEQARRYAEELQLLLRAIGVSDADMERGQLRVEANVSLRRRGAAAFGTRVEIKNMNSFRSVERAIASEIERQALAIDAGEAIVQETRGWDEGRGTTYVMRVKESSDDYRYFPEPDLPPLHLDPAWLADIRARQPELPAARRTRYAEAHGLSPYDASLIVGDAQATALFEALVGDGIPAKEAANWVAGEYLRLLRKFGEGAVPHVDVGDAGRQLGDVIRLVLADQLTRTNGKEVFETWFVSRRPVGEIVAERGFTKISDSVSLGPIVDEVLAANPQAIADYRGGKAQAVGFLVGQVMKATRGQANAAVVQTAVRERLEGTGDGAGEA